MEGCLFRYRWATVELSGGQKPAQEGTRENRRHLNRSRAARAVHGQQHHQGGWGCPGRPQE